MIIRSALWGVALTMLASGLAIGAPRPPLAGEVDPYVAAATDAGIPVQLLIAVAGAESSYHPWALNIERQPVFCRTRAEAEARLATIATTNVDIGLMQINWRFWGPRLGVTRNDLLEPRTNLLMGARILRDALDRDGSVWQRISNYHSGGLGERDRYNRQVYSAYRRYLRGEVR